MKKLLSIITIMLLLGQLSVPFYSYAQSEGMNEQEIIDQEDSTEEEIESEPEDNETPETEENEEEKIESEPDNTIIDNEEDK